MLPIARWLVHTRGFSVIPIDHPDATHYPDDPKKIGKVPIGPWLAFQVARPSDDNLVSWFGNGTPQNLALVMGAISNLVAVDADTPSALAWTIAHLPATPMRTKTARGEHWFFRHPGVPVPNRARIRVAGGESLAIDVRGDGGYVVAPTSKHVSGVIYERCGEWPAVAALPVFDPAWLEPEKPDAPGDETRHVRRAHERTDRTVHEHQLRRARAYLDAIPPAIEGQGGDAHTFQVCCKLVRGFDLSDADARDLLHQWNQRCAPPWSERELEEKIDGARKYGDEPIGGRIGTHAFTTTRGSTATDAPEPPSERRPLGVIGDGRTVRLVAASTITVRPVRWLWADRLALGTLGLLGGREGIGKTILAYTHAAAVTRGTLPGACFGTPRAVIVAATEDSWEHTIVPRLMAAGADLDRVFRVDVVTSEGADTTLSMPLDLPALKRAVEDVRAVLIILDPLLSRLSSALDTHKDAEVRIALEPLVAIAHATDACILGLIHVNKSASSDVLTLLMGSRAFAAVARSVLFVMTDPEDESRRLLGQAKNNLGRTDLPTLAFRIVGVKVADTPEGEVWTGKLDWLGESDRSIQDAIETATEAAGDRTATSEAGDWLADYLSTQDNRTAESEAVKREGKLAGHSADALKRARRKIRVGCDSHGFPRRTVWILPVGAPAGRLHPTAPTAPTALTGVGETSIDPPTGYQLAQSAQSAQSDDGPHTRATTGGPIAAPRASRPTEDPVFNPQAAFSHDAATSPDGHTGSAVDTGPAGPSPSPEGDGWGQVQP